MKKPFLVLALLLVSASPALAQINLAWRNCISVTTGANSALANINYACDGNFTMYRGVISFVAPVGITRFQALETYVDIQTASPTLPDFWRNGFGECRSIGTPSFNSGSFTGIGTGSTGSCVNPYIGSLTGHITQYTSDSPSPGRATWYVQLHQDPVKPLTAGQHYLGDVFTMDTYRDIDFEGSGVCSGCSIPACLTVTKVVIHQDFGTPFTLTSQDTRRWITWQGGTPNCASATPVRNQTWGAIKAIYR